MTTVQPGSARRGHLRLLPGGNQPQADTTPAQRHQISDLAWARAARAVEAPGPLADRLDAALAILRDTHTADTPRRLTVLDGGAA